MLPCAYSVIVDLSATAGNRMNIIIGLRVWYT